MMASRTPKETNMQWDAVVLIREWCGFIGQHPSKGLQKRVWRDVQIAKR